MKKLYIHIYSFKYPMHVQFSINNDILKLFSNKNN